MLALCEDGQCSNMRTCDLLGCCLTTRVTDMLLIGLSCVVLRHGLADMERSQVTPVTFVLDTSTAQSRLTEYVLTLKSG